MADLPLPRFGRDLRCYADAMFAAFNPSVAADLSDFLGMDPTLPENYRASYAAIKAFTENPVQFARGEILKAQGVAPEDLGAAVVSDAQISNFLRNYKPPTPPRVVLVYRSLDFTGGVGSTATTNSILANGGTKSLPFKINGGRNAVVLGVRGTTYVNGGVNSINTDLIEYKDVDGNRYPWCDSTPMTNVCGVAESPGLITPQKWYGLLDHTITMTNNFTSNADVRLSYACAIVYTTGS